MDTIVAITSCIAFCGTRQAGDDDAPPPWLRGLQADEHPQGIDYGSFAYHDGAGRPAYADAAEESGGMTEKPGLAHAGAQHAGADELDDVSATAARVVALLRSATSRADVDANEHVRKVRARMQAEAPVDGSPVDRPTMHAVWKPQWRRRLAEAVLERLVETVLGGTPDTSPDAAPGERLTTAGDDAKADLQTVVDWARRTAPEVFAWAADHPYLTACVAFAAAVAVVWVLAPWVLEAAGFGELGPVAESVAARLQMRYMGQVPAGSWFSFFQRLGMVWKH